jgi:hypothetical protein
MDEKNQKKKKAEPVIFNTQDMVEIWNEVLQKVLQNKKGKEGGEPFPVFTKGEARILTLFLFGKPEEFTILPVKKCDKRAVREFLGRREATRQGLSYKVSSIYLRRKKFIGEFIKSGFNAAEAARRCGYSWKYAKQVAYKIRKGFYSSPYW